MTVREQYELLEKKCELPHGFDPIAVYVNGTRVDRGQYTYLWDAEVEDYDIDDEDGSVSFEATEKRVDYKGDERYISLEDLEKVLCDKYGWTEYDKECGCYCSQGGWFSIDKVLKAVANSEYLKED